MDFNPKLIIETKNVFSYNIVRIFRKRKLSNFQLTPLKISIAIIANSKSYVSSII